MIAQFIAFTELPSQQPRSAALWRGERSFDRHFNINAAERRKPAADHCGRSSANTAQKQVYRLVKSLCRGAVADIENCLPKLVSAGCLNLSDNMQGRSIPI